MLKFQAIIQVKAGKTMIPLSFYDPFPNIIPIFSQALVELVYLNFIMLNNNFRDEQGTFIT